MKRIGGDVYHPLYNTWNHMHFRCYNRKSKFFCDYGGRGILVCDDWFVFKKFIEDMGARPTQRHSLDRINNDGHYCKENCRWSLPGEQQMNKRNVLKATIGGVTRPLVEWSRIYGMDHKLVRSRVRYGWLAEMALTMPVDKSNGGKLLHLYRRIAESKP